jgi:hypothetical protein
MMRAKGCGLASGWREGEQPAWRNTGTRRKGGEQGQGLTYQPDERRNAPVLLSSIWSVGCFRTSAKTPSVIYWRLRVRCDQCTHHRTQVPQDTGTTKHRGQCQMCGHARMFSIQGMHRAQHRSQRHTTAVYAANALDVLRNRTLQRQLPTLLEPKGYVG